MIVSSVDVIPVSIPYRHRELSYQVSRDGVTDVVIRIESNDGTVGWGEACSGADTASIVSAVHAMVPFVVGRSCWDAERMRRDLWRHGLWQFRQGTGNFAWAGLDMALWDLCGKESGLPLHRLLGRVLRNSVNYFHYLSWDDEEGMEQQCRAGLSAGYDVFYLKVGLSPDDDLRRVRQVREWIGPEPRMRLDANGAWDLPQARTMLRQLVPYDIDFVEQPVRESPSELMAQIRRDSPISIASNEGLWTEDDAIRRVLDGVSDVYCFSQYWVGSLRAFQFIGTLAGQQGASVCKHTHGELAIAASAAHHVLLTLPAVVRGNQQTSTMLAHDLAEVPISTSPDWGVPNGPGLGVEVDPDALAEAADRYAVDGQYLPYRVAELRPTW